MRLPKLVFLLVILLFSCQTDEFESSNYDDPSILKRNEDQNSILLSDVKAAYNDYDLDYNFTKNYIEKYGQVEWDNFLFYSDSEIENGIVYFPIKKLEDNEAQGMLVGVKLPTSSGINIDVIGKDEVLMAIENPDEYPRINLLNEVKIFNIFDSSLYGKGENDLIDGPDKLDNNEAVQMTPPCDDCIIKPIIQDSDENGDSNTNEDNDNNNSSTDGDGNTNDGDGEINDTGPDRGNDTNNENGGSNNSGGNSNNTGNTWSSNYAGSGWGWSGTGTGGDGSFNGGNNSNSDGGDSNNSTGGDGDVEYPPLPDEGEEDEDILIEARLTGDVYVTIDCAEGNYSGSAPEITQANAEDAISMAQNVGLDCNEMDCLFKNSDVLSKMEELLASYNFPCEQESTTSMVQNLVSDVCENQKSVDRMDKLLDALSAVDKIENNLSDPRLKCIFEDLILGSDKIFCNTYENFLGNSVIDLNLQNSDQVVGYAQATYYDENSPYGNTVDIAFNQNQMENHCEITIVGAFLHEGIHAEMFRQLNDPSLNPEDFASIWDEFDNEISDHENMAQTYIDNLTTALEQRFGDKYTPAEYEAIAWHGLGDINGEGVNTSAWNALSETKKASLKKTFSDINNDCSKDDCK